MEYDPKTPQYLTSDPSSFGYVSARERWPVIIVRLFAPSALLSIYND
jgi:hypothetical protein